MKTVFTKKWWQASSIRAIKTFAQTMLGVLGASTVIETVDWKMAVSAALLSAFTSFLTSIAGLPEVKENE